MRRITREKEQELIEAYRNTADGGKTLARKLGVGGTTLYRVLQRNSVSIDPSKIKTPFGPRWKFSLTQSRQIAELYTEGVKPAVLAEQFSCSRWTIRNAVRRHGLGVLRRGGQLRSWSGADKQDIMTRAQHGESQQSIAKQYSTSQVTVSRILKMAGCETKRIRESHGSWKGGRSVSNQGYVMVVVEAEDPNASMRMGNGYVLEHRLVMARHVGRPLSASETVHHINGNRADNRIENLELHTGRHGRGVILVCADCGSQNIAERKLAEGAA